MDPLALVISRDQGLVGSVCPALRRAQPLETVVVSTCQEVFRHLGRPELALVVVHLGRRQSDVGEVAEFLNAVSKLTPLVPIIILSDHPNPQIHLDLLRLGACDFLERPIDLNRLSLLADVLTVSARHHPEREPVRKGNMLVVGGGADPFLIDDGDFAQLVEAATRVASQDCKVLLSGETGTGKTRLAHLIHEWSPRRRQPFLTLDCGSLSPSLIESELFGHMKGAFTGADRDHLGKFAEAGEGTLCLDDVDCLSLDLQTKLLRVVDENEFVPVGSSRVTPMKARLIVTTNKNLWDEVQAHRFRSDLYYRLNVVEFLLLPLRERPKMIRPLAEYFLATLARKTQQHGLRFSPDALHKLESYSWPGNIRELRNAMERGAVLCKGNTIDVDCLPPTLWAQPPAAPPVPPVPGVSPAPEGDMPGAAHEPDTLAKTREMAEAQRIVAALAKHRNNRLRAAAELGISRMTLYKKLHQYGLTGGSHDPQAGKPTDKHPLQENGAHDS